MFLVVKLTIWPVFINLNEPSVETLQSTNKLLSYATNYILLYNSSDRIRVHTNQLLSGTFFLTS